MGQFVNEECRSKFLKHVCGSALHPCIEHTHNGQTYSLPRSMCRSDCDEFMDVCRDEMIRIEGIIHSVPVMRMYGAELYDTWCSMTNDMNCNSSPDSDFCFEQFRANSPISFVDILQKQPAFPEEGAILPDGTLLACSSNDKEYEGADIECPVGFSSYDGEETEDLCVFPCVSFVFEQAAIDGMWGTYLLTGFFGFFTNVLIVVTYLRLGKKSNLPRFVALSAGVGLVYSVFDTLPVAALKQDLPCNGECTDEYCHGELWLCKLQQPSEYLLLAIFCILLDTILALYQRSVLSMTATKIRGFHRIYTGACVVFITTLVVLCFLADSALATGSDVYRQLIVARDLFSCGPRYSSYTQEWAFSTLPFMIVCFALVSVTAAMVWNVWQIMKKTPGTSATDTISKFGKTAGKLMLLALMVSILWAVRVVLATLQEPIVEGFNEDTKTWVECLLYSASSASFLARTGEEPAWCADGPDTRPSTESGVLMICVKNLQACIVGVVWGLRGATKALSNAKARFSGSTSVAPGKSSGIISSVVVSSAVGSSVASESQ